MTNNNYRWILLTALSTMIFIINVDYTAVNLALIPISRDLHSNLNTIQWILSAYVLAWAVLVIPAGKYMDQFSKSTLCLLGLSLFLLASLFAGCATSANMLITARVLQGVAGAIYVPTIYALIYIYFSEKERGLAIGLMSLGVGLGLATGPVFGGVLLALFNWRSIFFINIPIGLIALLIIYANPNKEQQQNTATPICKFSVILLSFSVVTLLYLLSQWQVWMQHSTSYSILSVIALVSLALFIVLQQKLIAPLIPLNLFRHLSFSGCVIGILLEQYAFSTIIVATGLYLQKILLFSALQSCAMYLSLTIIFGIIAALGGMWVDRIGLKIPTVLGLALIAVGSLLFIYLSSGSSLITIGIIFLILGIGMGLAFSGLNTGIVTTVSSEHIGIASSIFVMFALLGNSLGVMFTALIYERSSLTQLLHSLKQYSITIEQNQIQQLAAYIANIGSQSPNLNLFSSALQTMITHDTTDMLNHGISQAMLANCIISIIAVVCCSLLIRKKI